MPLPRQNASSLEDLVEAMTKKFLTCIECVSAAVDRYTPHPEAPLVIECKYAQPNASPCDGCRRCNQVCQVVSSENEQNIQ